VLTRNSADVIGRQREDAHGECVEVARRSGIRLVTPEATSHSSRATKGKEGVPRSGWGCTL
jgi:hypothetical protein